MPLLLALLSGLILMEGLTLPYPSDFALDPLSLLLASTSQAWLLAWVGFAWACCTPKYGRGHWLTLFAVAVGACSSAFLPTPFFWLGPWWAGGLLGLVGWIASRWGRPDEPRSNGFTYLPAPWFFAIGFASILPLLALSRWTWRMGTSQAPDLHVNLCVFLVLVACGAVAFGRLVPLRKTAIGVTFSLAAVGLVSFAALRAGQSLATERGLRTLVRRFELDTTYAGTPVYSALITTTLLIMPAFALGCLLYCTESRRQRVWMSLGSASGLALLARLLESNAVANHAAGPTQVLFVIGVLTCALVSAGTLCWNAKTNSKPGRLALVALLPLLGIGGAVMAFPFEPLVHAKPWSRVVKQVLWSKELPQGQITLTNEGRYGFGARLDQRQITPNTEYMRLDERMLAFSIDLLDAEKRRNARVLLCGLLTPERLQILRFKGVRYADRVTTFWKAGEVVEEELFRNAKLPLEWGEWISPLAAWQNIQTQHYDLVIVTPECTGFANMPSSTPQVRWTLLDAGIDSGSAAQPLGDSTWMLCSDGLERFAVGSLSGAHSAETPDGLWKVNAGKPLGVGSRWFWMQKREWDREPVARAQFFKRLEQVEQAAGAPDLFSVLADFQAIQKPSSPYENEAQRVEITAGVQQRVVDALGALSPDGFVEEIAGGLARIWVGKRDVASAIRWLPDLSLRLGEPFELERSIARAELESLDPQAAAQRLERLDKRFPKNHGILHDLAMALDQSDQATRAAQVWGQILENHPDDFAVEKSWVLALLRAGDPRAAEALRSLQERHPEDEGLQSVSQNGPQILPTPEYTPGDGRHEGHDEHE